jgi:hypothetical protein
LHGCATRGSMRAIAVGCELLTKSKGCALRLFGLMTMCRRPNGNCIRTLSCSAPRTFSSRPRPRGRASTGLKLSQFRQVCIAYAIDQQPSLAPLSVAHQTDRLLIGISIESWPPHTKYPSEIHPRKPAKMAGLQHRKQSHRKQLILESAFPYIRSIDLTGLRGFQ